MLLLASCVGIRAKDETVAEHRNDAAIHQQRARNERAQFDPSDVQRSAPRAPGQDPLSTMPPETSYNPSASHLAQADLEVLEANQHLVAARTLIAFEHQACQGMTESERSSCPLFASTVSLIDVSTKGFTLTFQTQVDVGQTYRRLSCHLAHAVATGFDRPSCPLFVKGTTMERVGDRGIAFIGDSEAVAIRLRGQARKLFLGLDSTAPELMSRTPSPL